MRHKLGLTDTSKRYLKNRRNWWLQELGEENVGANSVMVRIENYCEQVDIWEVDRNGGCIDNFACTKLLNYLPYKGEF